MKTVLEQYCTLGEIGIFSENLKDHIATNAKENMGELLQETMYLEEAKEILAMDGIAIEDISEYVDFSGLIQLGYKSFSDSDAELTHDELYCDAFGENVFYFKCKLDLVEFDLSKGLEFMEETFTVDGFSKNLLLGIFEYAESGCQWQTSLTLDVLLHEVTTEEIETHFFVACQKD